MLISWAFHVLLKLSDRSSLPGEEAPNPSLPGLVCLVAEGYKAQKAAHIETVRGAARGCESPTSSRIPALFSPPVLTPVRYHGRSAFPARDTLAFAIANRTTRDSESADGHWTHILIPACPAYSSGGRHRELGPVGARSTRAPDALGAGKGDPNAPMAGTQHYLTFPLARLL